MIRGRSESWYIIIFVLIIIILIVVLLVFLCYRFTFLLIRIFVHFSSFFVKFAVRICRKHLFISFAYCLFTLCTNLLCRNISIFLLIRSFISIRSFFRMTLLDRFLCGRLFLPWRLCGKRFFCRSRSDFLFDWSFFPVSRKFQQFHHY